MIKNGTRPTRPKHTDWDFFKNHTFGAIAPTIPDSYFADVGLTMPDQNSFSGDFLPPTPPEPFGCTNFAQSDLRTDLIKIKTNPSELEAVTHANAYGGIDIRESLDAAVSLGWFKSYFNLRPKGIWDFFETFQLGQVAGIAAGENRAITWGTPWFPSWEQSALNKEFIMPMPTDTELAAIRKDAKSFSWHDSVLDGWGSENGILYYRDKSWQGNHIGRGGFIAFTRETINMVMGINGTVGYTASNIEISNPLPIDLNTLEWILSFIRNFLRKDVTINS